MVVFYQKFWGDISTLVINSLNYGFALGFLSTDQSRGVISLFPKEDKDNSAIKNWRPITLLNFDYKLGAKCIAARIKRCLDSLIHCNQTGFIKGRCIGENVRIVLDTISYCNRKNIPGPLLFIDFENAFDSLSWNFLYGEGERIVFCGAKN